MACRQIIKDNIGAEIALLDSQIFMDSNISWFAESMSAKVNTIIEEKSAEMTALMAKLAIKR